jgi:capsular exopolysaccharide synthesis family protein
MERPPGPEITPFQPEDDASHHLLDYWRILVQRRWVVFACIGVVTATALFLTLFSTPQYRATSTLQIDRRGPDVLAFKDVVGVDPSWASYQDFYQTQYRILQSRSVLKLAVVRLDLPNRPEYAGRTAKPITRLIGWFRGLLSSQDEGPVDPIDPAVAFLAGGLAVSPVRNSQLVAVSFTDQDPVLSRDAANAIASAYLEFSFRALYDTTAVARDFLTKEVARVRREIAELEERLQDYGTSKEILAIDGEGGDISRQALSSLSAQYVEARGRLAVAQADYEAVSGANPASLPEVLESRLIEGLKQQHAEVERRYSLLAERFREDWPPLQELRGEMEQAEKRLELETNSIASQVRQVAEAEYERAKAEVKHLETQVEKQKREVQRVNRDAVEYASLKAEIDTKRQLLLDLASRQSETQTSERLRETNTSNIRVVDAAEVPKFPIGPNKKFNLLLALLVGTGLGIGMAFLLDYLDNTIKSESDIQRIAATPVLGYVPHYLPLRVVEGEDAAEEPTRPQIDIASFRESRSAFSEAFRDLRTSLLLASPDRPPRRIVVTSCEPDDGKSTVSANLSIVLTQLGRRVLLIDSDLRKPRMHRVFDLENSAGLSSVLSGNAEPEELLRETLIHRLSVVTSGPIPPNPSELLGSTGLESFLEHVEQQGGFDHIIMDSPPVVSVTDPVILAAIADATLLVVRQGKTARESLAQSVQRLRQSRARLAGAVLNAVTEESGKYYYKRYRYHDHFEETAGADGRERAPDRSKRRWGRRRDRSVGGA